jgi:PAS domain S-box-containing protein
VGHADRSDLVAAIRSVRETVEKKLRFYRRAACDETFADLGRMQALELGIEELNVLWEELQGQSEHLARERQRYAELFDFAPDAYLVTDADGKIGEANRAAVEMLLASAAYLANKPLVLFIPFERRPEFRSKLRDAASSAKRKTWRGSLQRADGAILDVEFSVGGITRPGSGALSLCWLLRALE